LSLKLLGLGDHFDDRFLDILRRATKAGESESAFNMTDGFIMPIFVFPLSRILRQAFLQRFQQRPMADDIALRVANLSVVLDGVQIRRDHPSP